MFGFSRLALPALLLPALLVAGCTSGDLSGDSVARVGNQVVDKNDLRPYQEAAMAATIWLKTPTGDWVRSKPVGPDYTDCVAAKKQVVREIPTSQEMKAKSDDGDQFPLVKGDPDNENEAMRASCKSDAEGARVTAIQQLLSATWVQQAADRLGVTVSEEDVRQSRNQQLETLSQQSGLSVQQLLDRAGVSLDVLDLSVANQIRFQMVSERLAKASEEEMLSYYEKNKDDVFTGLSYEESKATIARILSEKTPDELSAQKMRAATVCADNYRVLMCGNREEEEGVAIGLVSTTSINQMLYPQANSAIVNIAGPGGGIVGDDPASSGDGGAVYGDVSDFSPKTEAELEKILKEETHADPFPETGN